MGNVGAKRVAAASLGFLLVAQALPGDVASEEIPTWVNRQNRLMDEDPEHFARSVASAFVRFTRRKIDDGLLDAWIEKVTSPDFWRRIELSRDEKFSTDQPAFDDGWWPAGLASLGIPKPAVLDEHPRERWQWASDMHRLIQERGDDAKSSRNAWPALTLLLERYNAFWELEQATIDGWPGIDDESKRAARSFVFRGCDPDLASLLDPVPELRDRLVENRLALRALLAEPTVDLLRTKSSSAYAPPVPIDVQDSTVWSRHRRQSRYFAGYLEQQIMQEVRDGDLFAAASTLSLLYTIGTGLSYDPSVQGAEASFWVMIVHDMFTRGLVGQQVNERLLSRVEEITDRFAPTDLLYGVQGSRISRLASIDGWIGSFRTDRAFHGPTRLLCRDLSESFGIGASRGVRAALIEIYADALATSIAEAAPHEERQRADRVISWFRSEGGRQEIEERLGPGGVGFGFDWQRVRDGRARAFGYRDALRIMIAIERFRLAHGTLPASLEELPLKDSSILHDQLAGEPFRYVRGHHSAPVPTSEGVGFATGYLLYSVGTDGVDNDGKHPGAGTGRAYAMRRFRASVGLDFVFNLPLDDPDPAHD